MVYQKETHLVTALPKHFEELALILEYAISLDRDHPMESASVTVAIAEGRRERRKRELRTRIYETARQLFLSQGFEATTVVQIADAADIAQATFFNHFASKQAVLVEMTNEVSVHLQRLVDDQLGRSVSAPERIRGFAESVASELARAGVLAREVMLELMRSSSQPGEAYPYLARAHAPLLRIIREGQQHAEVRTDRDAAFLTEMVLGCLNIAVTRWIGDPAYPLAEQLRETADFVSEAIGSRTSAGEPPAPRR